MHSKDKYRYAYKFFPMNIQLIEQWIKEENKIILQNTAWHSERLWPIFHQACAAGGGTNSWIQKKNSQHDASTSSNVLNHHPCGQKIQEWNQPQSDATSSGQPLVGMGLRPLPFLDFQESQPYSRS